jgi:hypothetical protein
MPICRFVRTAKVAACLAVLASIAASCVGQTPPPIAFNARRDFPVGQSPDGIATADLNSDGKMDMVTLNQSSNDVSVLLGNGDGTFQPAVSYSVLNSNLYPLSLTLGDFNGDGKLDIFLASASSSTGAIVSVSVLLGNGDGTFQAQKVTDIVNSNSRIMTIGDFNNDGKLDIAFTVPVPQIGSSALNVMLGNSDGTFQAAIMANPGPYGFGALEVADFNGDGKVDLVNGDYGFSVFLGNGDGTFQNPINTPFSSEGVWFLVADFNGDGKPDIACQATSPGTVNVAVLFGNGDGTFSAPIITSLGNSPFSVSPFVSPATADFNGDGKPDLLLSNYSQMGVLLGNGDGTFQVVTPFVMPGGSVAAGDFNGDGKLDIASASSVGTSGFASIAFGNGDGTFQVETYFDVPSGPIFIITGDFTGDGKTDLLETVVQKLDTILYVLPGNGNGTFQPAIAGPIAPGCGSVETLATPCPVVAGDLNGDGKLDVVTTAIPSEGTACPSCPNIVSVFLGNGDGTFQPVVSYDGGGESVILGDFSGNGAPDIVTSGSILFNNGNGTFGFPTALPVSGTPAVGDFNNDGKLDLALAAGTSVEILLGNGDGTFGAAVQYPTAGGSAMVVVADFNGDGNLDLATANSTFNSVSILLGKGDGTFGASTNYPVPASAIFIGAADLNGDGKLDLAVLNGVDVSVLAGNGDGTFQPAVNFGTSGSVAFTIADLNGDGSPDIAVNGVSLLFNRGTGPAAGLSASFVDFGNTALGFTGGPLSVTLSNTGTVALTIGGVTLTGAESGDFKQTNTCGASVAAAASCTFSVSFTPSALGVRNASIQVADNAFGAPQTINLTGTGVTPAPGVTLVPGTVSFGSQTVGVVSAPQSVTLTNSGTATLTITTAITLTGPQSSDFAESNTCGSSVMAGAKCTISVTFTPAAAGLQSATLSVTDNASGSPQAVALSGTGVSASLGLGTAAGGASSATVTAGQTASYTLSIGGQGVSGTATVSCTGAPTGANCTVPGSVTVSATSASTFTVSVSTTARSTAAITPNSSPLKIWLGLAILGMILLPGSATGARFNRRLIRILPIALLLFVGACGGSGGSSGTQPNPTGTPAGKYTVTVTATSGSTTQSVPLTLTVQ